MNKPVLPRLRKCLILVMTLYATLAMLHWPLGFTYFTQLSNLYAAAIAACLLVRRPGRTLALLQYTAAVSISLTFAVFLLVLAPLNPRGLFAAYAQDHGASLCMHLLTPVLTVWDYLADSAGTSLPRRRHIPFAVLPPLVYFLFILILGQCGLRWGGMSAPYPFLNYSAPAGWFGFRPETFGRATLGVGVFYAVLVMLLAVLLFGWGLQAASSRRRCFPEQDESLLKSSRH